MIGEEFANLDQIDFESSDEKFPGFSPPMPKEKDVVIKDGNLEIFSTIGKRKSNLDHWVYVRRKKWLMVALFDAHGSSGVALYLKDRLLTSIYTQESFNNNPKLAFRQGFSQCAQEINQSDTLQDGSTALVVLITSDKIVVGCLGDTKLFAVNKKTSKLQALTEEHNLFNPKEVDRCFKNGACLFPKHGVYRINGYLNLSRSFGDKKYQYCMLSEPEIKEYPVKAYSKLVLASDGIYEKKDFEQKIKEGLLIGHLGKQLDQEETKGEHELKEIQGNQQQYADNATAITIQLL